MKQMLVIIDMQEGFGASHCDRITANIIREIEDARKQGHEISVLEYADHHRKVDGRVNHGRTRGDIMLALFGYHYSILSKTTNGGGDEIENQVVLLGYTVEDFSFNIAGVNFSACVESTIRDLADKEVEYDNINVLEECCNNPGCYGDEAWSNTRNRIAQVATIDYDDTRSSDNWHDYHDDDEW